MSPLVSRQTCGKENVLGVGIFLIYLAVLLMALFLFLCTGASG